MAWFRDDLGNNRDVNDPETQFDIDVEHYNEAGGTPDYSEAAKLCKLAAEQGHAPAQYNLGFMYEMGQGVEQDASEALKWYRAAADNGYVPAQLELGEMYESGTVGARDYGDAVKWYRLAADQGNADAQLRLGNMYREGQGVSQDYNEAANWYRLAGEQEHSEAQYNLGRMYESGSIGAIDYEEATKWYRLAADQGHPEATNELKKGEPKSIPEGVVEQQPHPRTSEQKSPKQPEPILEEPSKITDPETQYEIGNKYYKGEDVIRDYNEAAKWYRLAADQGDANAQYNLGVMYARGYGVTQNYTESVKWYRLAADQGFAEAQNNLGGMYKRGYGVTQDYDEAVKWYRLAAEQGLARASFRLGIMYERDDGVKQDYTEAVKWYRLAADQRLAEAQHKLGAMHQYGVGVKQDYTEAIEWYGLAAAQGDALAQYNLGQLYEIGPGMVLKDYTEAIKWYQLAADQGHTQAKAKLKELELNLTPKDTFQQKSDKSDVKEKVSIHRDHKPQDISDKTDPETQFEIGRKYYSGLEVTRNYSEAVKWYRLAANQGYANAQCNLGNMYSWGCGVTQDYAEALKWYRLAADQGHSDAKTKLQELERKLTPKETGQQKSDKSDEKEKASEPLDPILEEPSKITDPETQYHTGNKYRYAMGVARDYSHAAKWYRLAADQGHVRAQVQLGDMYYCGQGVPEDDVAALKWYRLAAKQGHSDARTKLQVLKRKLTPKDHLQQKSRKSIGKKQVSNPLDSIPEEPSKITDPETQFEIGNKYYNGEEVERDYSEAIKWYRLAADQGNAAAINKLKEIGLKSTPKYKVARKTHKPVSRKVSQVYDTTPDELDKITDPATQFYIGNKYSSGNGVAQNYREAVKWHRLSADQGYAPAQYNLGRMYDLGFGVEEDCNEAVKWFRLAAQQGNLAAINKLKEIEQELSVKTDPEILFQIGNKYYSGYEVTRDYSEAVKWYRRAAYQGHANAQSNLGNMYSWGCGVTQNHAEAVKWYRLAADQGDSDAQYNLGEKYEKGLGVAQDYDETIQWYRLATNQGHSDARAKLQSLERKLTPKDKGKQKYIKSNGKKDVSKRHDPKPTHLDKTISDPKSNKIVEELNKLIGMERVKKEIYQLIQVVRVQKMRSKEGLYSDDYHVNCIFLGSPSTGKTTVANLFAEMLHSMGVLSKGHLVKTSRQGLVAGDIRQTELKTDAKIDEALGGILFIEHAHDLFNADDGSWDYGQEVINILLKRMEDHQNDFVVILAGYPESMDNFIEANEGLRSQFPTIVHFDDYAPGELLSMLNLFCLKANYEIEPKAIETLRIIIAEAYESGDMNLRNARFVRNLFESLRKWQSVRIGETVDNPTIEDLKRITTADVELLKTNR